MKGILLILAIIIIGGVGYYVTTQNGSAPADMTTDTIEMNEDTTMTTDETEDTMETEAMNDTNTMSEVEMNTTQTSEPAATTEEDDTTTSVDTETTTEVGDTGEVTTETETAVTSEVKTFDITGTNFSFDVETIRVQEGDTVTINFESAEGFHDWRVDEFDAATEQVRPGTPTSVTFVADEAGTYEYYCSVGSHRAQGMVGTLIVE